MSTFVPAPTTIQIGNEEEHRLFMKELECFLDASGIFNEVKSSPRKSSPRKQILEIVKGREDDHGTIIMDTFTQQCESDVDEDYEFDIISQKSESSMDGLLDEKTVGDRSNDQYIEVERQLFEELDSTPSLFDLYDLDILPPQECNNTVVNGNDLLNPPSLSTPPPIVTDAASDNLYDIDINDLVCYDKHEDNVSNSPIRHTPMYGMSQDDFFVFDNFDYSCLCLQNSDFILSLLDNDLLSDDTQ